MVHGVSYKPERSRRGFEHTSLCFSSGHSVSRIGCHHIWNNLWNVGLNLDQTKCPAGQSQTTAMNSSETLGLSIRVK